MAALEESTRSTKPIKLVGRYAIFDRIAAGGMASVHLGRLVGAAGFSRTVAIKRLKSNFAKDPKFVTMFSDEARVAARIRHPNVAATIDVVSDADELLLVLEYVHGESLSRLSKLGPAGRAVEPKIAVAVAMGALHGLHAAHEAKSEHGERLGIIHRDVSPQNILIGDDGVPRVVDFGVAKAAGRMQRTDAGHVKGKPRYMAPEQLEGDEFPIDHRVDVFSMGTVLWEALTGKPLFNHATFMGVLAQVVKMEIPAPHEVEPSISRALSRVVHRALSRDLSKRWATALEFAVALEEAAASEGLIATQHTLGAWVRERAAPILAERQTIIESIERRTLSLRDPPRISDPDEDAEPSASSPSFPLPPPLENRAPEPAPTPRPRVDRPSDVLASMKTIKMPPKAAASEDDEPDRPTLEQDRPTLPTRIHPVRTTDLMPPEPGEAGAPVGLDEPAEPAFARIQVPAQAEQAAAFSKLMETPSDTPPPTVAAPPRRVPWLLVAAILLAIAVVLVMLLFSELGRS